jgi:hypothetical protein
MNVNTDPAPVDPTAHLNDHHYPSIYADFLRNTAKHEMTVLKEDGLYRHLRFREPGTNVYGYDVITWPGYISLVGDIADGYQFSREPDMLAFIDSGQRPGEIYASYWAEKLVGRGRADVETYSENIFKRGVLELIEDAFYTSDPEDAAEVVTLKATSIAKAKSELFPHAGDEHEAREALDLFIFIGIEQTEEKFSDTWELSFSGHDYHFILACHAMLNAARAFHTMDKARSEAAKEPTDA